MSDDVRITVTRGEIDAWGQLAYSLRAMGERMVCGGKLGDGSVVLAAATLMDAIGPRFLRELGEEAGEGEPEGAATTETRPRCRDGHDGEPGEKCRRCGVKIRQPRKSEPAAPSSESAATSALAAGEVAA